jgi:5-methylcytosine-specific restriction endonuclease McrA
MTRAHHNVCMKRCARCDGPMEGKRPHAVYCSRRCKTAASDDRRKADGRAHIKDRARYAAEAPRRRRQASEWSRRSPELVRLKRWRRKARRLTQDCRRITERDWLRIVLAYRVRCAYCEAPGPLHMDHVIPLSRGGRHAIGNVVPACPPCNLAKSSSLLIEWRARGRG